MRRQPPISRFYSAYIARFVVNRSRTVLNYLLRGCVQLSCAGACNFNSDVRLDIGDAIFALNYLFRAGAPPPIQEGGILFANESSFRSLTDAESVGDLNARIGSSVDPIILGDVTITPFDSELSILDWREDLDDNGQWMRNSIEFQFAHVVHIMLEDFSGSGGVPWRCALRQRAARGHLRLHRPRRTPRGFDVFDHTSSR
jgi:hypothetical protein